MPHSHAIFLFKRKLGHCISGRGNKPELHILRKKYLRSRAAKEKGRQNASPFKKINAILFRNCDLSRGLTARCGSSKEVDTIRRIELQY